MQQISLLTSVLSGKCMVRNEKFVHIKSTVLYDVMMKKDEDMFFKAPEAKPLS